MSKHRSPWVTGVNSGRILPRWRDDMDELFLVATV
jgi:hypothetical protein